MAGPTMQFWQEQFEQGHIPWDRGGVNPQLEEWLASGALSPCRILVPGCGSGYEVVALAQAGFDVRIRARPILRDWKSWRVVLPRRDWSS